MKLIKNITEKIAIILGSFIGLFLGILVVVGIIIGFSWLAELITNKYN